MLEAEIAKLTGKKVRARYEQDATLLGGAVVQVGSTIYDGSVKGQLEQNKRAVSGELTALSLESVRLATSRSAARSEDVKELRTEQLKADS